MHAVAEITVSENK